MYFGEVKLIDVYLLLVSTKEEKKLVYIQLKTMLNVGELNGLLNKKKDKERIENKIFYRFKLLGLWFQSRDGKGIRSGVQNQIAPIGTV